MKTLPHTAGGRRIEVLETRIAPATHEWTGLGANNLWSTAENWTNGSPATDGSGDIDLVFHTNLLNTAFLVSENNIGGLVVDSITFDANPGTGAAGGTSTNGYTINGLPITINAGGAGQNPFGIDLGTGMAPVANVITHTFNAALVLSTSDATFRSAQINQRLTLNGDINLGGRTLTFDWAGNNSTAEGVLITGDVSNGSLAKTGGGTLRLTGENSFTNATVNDGFVLVESDKALGASAGVVTVNDPGKVQLRNGVTVTKAALNLNSNQIGGGLGADGNTTNTFRGSVVLMAGNGGVALGSGVDTANAGTRLIIDGVISGATSALSLNGAGVIEFTSDNTFTGQIAINGNQGYTVLQLNTPGGLGATGSANRTNIFGAGGGQVGGSVWFNFDGVIQEDIDFGGSGTGGNGAIRVLGDHAAVLAGNVTLISPGQWTLRVDAGSLTLTGIIDSQITNRGLTKVGEGKLTIAGTGGNEYGGSANDTINAGTFSVQNTSATPLGNAARAVIVNGGGTLSVEAGVEVPNAVSLATGGVLTGEGTVGNITSAGGIISPGASVARLTSGSVTLNSASIFLADVNGATAGTLHDQLRVTGLVNLGGATLALNGSFVGDAGDVIVLIENDGGDAVTGTFGGLAEGARIAAGGRVFSLTYVGGTGNDVVLTAVAPTSSLVIGTGGRSATYTDVDGDLVTVKLTKGELKAADFIFAFAADNRQQLQRINLTADDAGTNLTITAKRSANGGDGFANVGHLSAFGVALGTLLIDGDLGRISAAAVKGLTVQSLGAFGVALQLTGGSLVSNLTGDLGKLTVKASIHGATLLGSGKIGAVTVLGSLLEGRISAGSELGAVSVRGDIRGTSDSPVVLSGFGKAVEPTNGPDVALKSLKVAGGVEHLRVLAGYDLALLGLNADATIGSIAVGADWRASSVLVGSSAGADGFLGTADDAKLFGGGVRDRADVFSSIGSILVKGQSFGSLAPGDSFGIIAELIGKAKVGKATLKFDAGARDVGDAFAIAATGPGASGLTSDVFIREVASV